MVAVSSFLLAAAASAVLAAPALATPIEHGKATTLAKRVDNRILVQHQSQDGTAFCDAYNSACQNYSAEWAAVNHKPASDVTFQQTYCQPGDFSGQNTNTEARVFCIYSDQQGNQLNFSQEVAQEIGATPA